MARKLGAKTVIPSSDDTEKSAPPSEPKSPERPTVLPPFGFHVDRLRRSIGKGSWFFGPLKPGTK